MRRPATSSSKSTAGSSSGLPPVTRALGTVGPDGALLSVTGHQTFTVDAESGLTTASSLDGRVRDLSAALEG
jgi:hypothetical protein